MHIVCMPPLVPDDTPYPFKAFLASAGLTGNEAVSAAVELLAAEGLVRSPGGIKNIFGRRKRAGWKVAYVFAKHSGLPIEDLMHFPLKRSAPLKRAA
jgi:hypothetical protein